MWINILTLNLILILTTWSCAAVPIQEKRCGMSCAKEISQLDFELIKARAAQMEMVAPLAFGRTQIDLDEAHRHYADVKSQAQVHDDVRSARRNMARAKSLFSCRKVDLEPLLRAREQARFAIHRCSAPKAEWVHELMHLDQRFKGLSAEWDSDCSIPVVEEPTWVYLRQSYLEFALKVKNMNCLLAENSF